MQDITDVDECRHATKQLKLIYGNIFNGPGFHRYCHFADDGRGKVFYNAGRPAAPKPQAEFHSICHLEVPAYLIQSCVPGTADTAIRVNGYWALAIFGLAGLWFSALNFVLILLAPQQQVHPEDLHEPAPKVEAWSEGGARRRQSQVARMRMTVRDNTKQGWEIAKKWCKKALKVIMHSVETMIGAAVFTFSAIALWVTAIVQLPLEKPECAREPQSASSLSAWASEPAFA